MNCGIYLIHNTITHKEYIGSSKNLRSRKYVHWYHLREGRHDNKHLQNSYDKYGKDSFCFVVLEYCSPENLIEKEIWWIHLLDTRNPNKGYNINDPVNGRLGIPHTSESRTKMSEKLMGNKHTLGYKHSNETKAKMSLIKMGNTVWEGRKHSEETKSKMSKAQQSRYFFEVQLPTGGVVIINNLTEFCSMCHLNKKSVITCIYNNRTNRGYRFRRV